MTSTAQKAALLRIFLLGPMVVLDDQDANAAPRNQKSKALLAMLALSPRGSRSRVWMRDKLWSDRGPDQAAASLRQALRDVRKSLGPRLRDILQADRYSISLDLSKVEVDVVALLEEFKDNPDLETVTSERISEHFLEGFDIYDPEFQAWLTLERQIWEQRFTSPQTIDRILENASHLRLIESPGPEQEAPVGPVAVAPLPAPAPVTHLTENSDWAIGLQGTGLLDLNRADNVGTKILAEKLTRNLADMGRIRTLRLVDGSISQNSTLKPRGVAIPLVVRITEAQQSAGIRLSVEILDGGNGVTFWSASQSIGIKEIADPVGAVLNGLATRTAMQTGRFLGQVATDSRMAASAKLVECINQIFALSTDDLNRAERTLTDLLKSHPNAQTYAWMAFAKSFQVGQRFTPDASAQISEAHYYATRALEEDAYDPLVLSLAAHIHSYLFCEYDVAASLFERALKADQEQTIAWDLYAMLHAYTGHGDTSVAMAKWAQHLGANTPFSYYYDTTRCIASALAGDHSASIRAGERALAQRPKFNSILRYLVSSHAHLGNADIVESLREKLETVEPDFSVEVLQETGYPGLGTEGGRQFLLGLNKAGFGSGKITLFPMK